MLSTPERKFAHHHANGRQAMRMVLIGVAVGGIVGGIAAGLWWQSQAGPEPVLRPDFSLVDLDNNRRHISEWDGKLVLLNFWATWCTPCLKEIPLLITAQNKYAAAGLQIIGPALDNTEAVRAYVAQAGINYPVLLGESAIVPLMDALGDEVGGLPFSVLIGRDGKILERHSGDLSAADIRQLLEPHL